LYYYNAYKQNGVIFEAIGSMVTFTTTIQQFTQKGEKTGWTYVEIPANIATVLKPNNKQSFRVKGKLDDFAINGIALLPMGEGNFIMALNAAIQKGTKKRKGALLRIQIEVDNEPLKQNAALMECLADEPDALAFFNQLPKGHQNYFTKWIESAKTEQTVTKRIAMAITAFTHKQGFGEMMKVNKNYNL
jgi:hypothetical protein